MSSVIGRIQALIGRCPVFVRWAVKARNQAEIIIESGLSPHLWDADRNGEYTLLDCLGSRIKRFIDVGANVGEWSAHLLSAVAPRAEGLLIEPNPDAAARLRERFSDRPGIEVLPVAVSDRPGRERLFLCGASAGCSLVDGVLPGAPSVEVDVATLDDLLRERGWNQLDFLKVDAEGRDLDVLSGARELLANRAIGFVQFEYMQAWALNGSALGGAIGLLGRAGYETRLLTPNGPARFDYGFYREFFRYANFVAATPDRWAELLESVP